MKPGTRVEILIDHLFGESGSNGVVADKNLTDGLISVHILDVYDEEGPILDFDKSFLKEIKE